MSIMSTYNSFGPPTLDPALAFTSLTNYEPMPLFIRLDHTCHFLRLPLQIRTRIYQLALDIDVPRKVFNRFSPNWKKAHLNDGESIQHSAGIIDMRTRVTQNRLRRIFTLRPYSAQELRIMQNRLFPPLLQVSREIRAEALRLFYRQAVFVAPGDPYTISEWEARLSLDALKCLALNPNLIVEHFCSETQQWRCLRGYLYNPSRQLYQVSSDALKQTIAEYWGKDEVAKREQLFSIPWKFVQTALIARDYPIISSSENVVEDMNMPSMNSLLYSDDIAFHEVFHSELIEEVQRIHSIQQTQTREAQLYHLAEGVRRFFSEMVNMNAGMMQVHGWLKYWLINPLGPFPRPLSPKKTPGGMFFGVFLFPQDSLVFVEDMKRNSKKALCVYE